MTSPWPGIESGIVSIVVGAHSLSPSTGHPSSLPLFIEVEVEEKGMGHSLVSFFKVVNRA